MLAVQVADDKARSLSWSPLPRPTPAAGEVLLQVAATAVNRADLLQRIGRYPVPPGITDVMGLEAAGRIVELGPEVEGWTVGQEVGCLLAGGGYAQYAVCPAGQLLPRPSRLSLVELAALPEALFTAYLNLYLLGGLTAGEHALVHAAASGVGSIALQLCRALGNPVHGTASGGKLHRLGELGALTAIDREQDDFVARVREVTEGRGVDVILDPVGGAYLGRNIDALANGGRLVVIGLLGGASAELPLGKLLTRRLQVLGSVLRARPVAEKTRIRDGLMAAAWPAVERGEILPVIEEVRPITEVAEAHALLRDNRTVGKVILTVPQ